MTDGANVLNKLDVLTNDEIGELSKRSQGFREFRARLYGTTSPGITSLGASIPAHLKVWHGIEYPHVEGFTKRCSKQNCPELGRSVPAIALIEKGCNVVTMLCACTAAAHRSIVCDPDSWHGASAETLLATCAA